MSDKPSLKTVESLAGIIYGQCRNGHYFEIARLDEGCPICAQIAALREALEKIADGSRSERLVRIIADAALAVDPGDK